MKNVLVIGGGTGTFTVLTGIRSYDLNIKVIVSMMDNGGSTGRLRDQLGVLPPGDLRQCLVALSQSSDLWRKLFNYRFLTGDLNGHNFGNIFITALEKNCEDYQKVVDSASAILQTKGEVIPVTIAKTNLCVKYQDGEIIKYQDQIDMATHKDSKIEKVFLSPKVKANKSAISAIQQADFIVLGPGDLYTSIIPNLVVDGIFEAFKKTKAKIIYIPNLMNKKGQTNHYAASNYVGEIEKYTGRAVDFIILNKAKIDKLLLTLYKDKEGDRKVNDDLLKDERVFRLALVSKKDIIQRPEDQVERSLIRHDSDKLAKVIWGIVNKKKESWIDKLLNY
jgi:uncharacterized cofD-like protein